jgi:5-methylcytosine-specific restriction enzyme subunit McrC
MAPLPKPVAAAERLTWTRRNVHYRPAIELAKLIVRGQMADVVAGDVPVQGFTLLMHDVFERFVRVALRTAWGASESEMPDSWAGKGPVLDQDGLVSLEPDLGWVADGTWRFVGDVKYKRDESGTGESSDIYQALAYAVATSLPEVVLVYGSGGSDRDHYVGHVGKVVRIRHLDLAQPPEQVLSQLTRVVG